MLYYKKQVERVILMSKLGNCERCGVVFAKTIRDICQACYQEEEQAFQTVYRYLTKRKNREATMAEIVEATKVEEDLIIKFMKENRLRASQFPKLSYPCEKCEAGIVEGKLCYNCTDTIKTQLKHHNQMEEIAEKRRKSQHESIYYIMQKGNK